MHLNSSKRRKATLRRKEAVAYVKHVRETVADMSGVTETSFPKPTEYIALLTTIKKFQ